MDFETEQSSQYLQYIRHLTNHSISTDELKVLQYTAGLKALLDVLPEDTRELSEHTVENYLWVIELLLGTIYDKLQSTNDREA